MNPEELKKSIRIFYPALALDRSMSRENRLTLGVILDWVFVLLFALVALGKMPTLASSFLGASWTIGFQALEPFFIGGLLITLSLWLVIHALEAFYHSYYFTGIPTALPEAGLSDRKPGISFEAAEVANVALTGGDFTAAFIRSRLGRRTLVRLGVGRSAVASFFSERTHAPEPAVFAAAANTAGPLGFADIAAAVAHADTEFYKFLSTNDISVKDFSGAAVWMERMEQMSRRRGRFWGRDSLGRIRGIGKDWSYGGAYALQKFAREIDGERASGAEEEAGERSAKVHSLEAVLARTGEANALLVADEGAGGMDVVLRLQALIRKGSVLPSLEHKRMFLFDVNAFIAFAKNKATFESALLHMLNESVRAGDIILVIPDLPNFIESAKSLGSDIVAFLDPYLASEDFQVIALASPGAFHEGLEGNSKILHRFEKILVTEHDLSATMRIVEDRAMLEESQNRVFFTYQGLSAVAEGARRYLTEGVLSDKAVHLLSEIVPAVLAKGKEVVERSDVLALIEEKTGIKTGEVGGSERDALLHLEDILHRRIIGQDEAVRGVSGALRRARSDIENPDRPMGSFLFLGPTGVGKTETTKALAATFFGKEESIIRLDMSEYQTSDALKRLIGSFEDGKPGVLSSRLREQPYGVLLLDEFEKTNNEVLDLFLQILDEGFFSDMSGRRVNARNLIIIATSNAGSDLIWQMLRGTDADRRGPHAEGEHLLDKDKIIAEIINRGIFKPELLNRFDGVILFHPLSTENLQKIAGLMLQKLQKRLAEKGIELVINDVLLKSVMAAGTDPEFGARPMNRAIQEKVEQVIAKKIIAGEAPSGSRLELTEAELA